MSEFSDRNLHRELKSLGTSDTKGGLEVFPAPSHVTQISLSTTEFTAVCPKTGQPDYYSLVVTYVPDSFAIESKSLKLFLWKFRDEGHFCEALSQIILRDLVQICKPRAMTVILKAAPRGGIDIESVAQFTDESFVPMDFNAS